VPQRSSLLGAAQAIKWPCCARCHMCLMFKSLWSIHVLNCSICTLFISRTQWMHSQFGLSGFVSAFCLQCLCCVIVHETLKKESPDRCHFCSLRDTYPRHINVPIQCDGLYDGSRMLLFYINIMLKLCATGHTHLCLIQPHHFCMKHVAQLLQNAHVTNEYHKMAWVGG
jgi:hypothetical protein